METRKETSICLEPPSGVSSAREDLISKLPEALIIQILLYLPKKEAVRTCVLSKRWKSVWRLIPTLDLDSNEFSDYNAFVGFMDRFLDFYREQDSCLHKLKLSIEKYQNDQSCATRWIDFVATRRLKHLDVEFGRTIRQEYWEVMPVSLYVCETLLHLRLYQVLLGNFESVSLPRLKTMCLEQNVYPNEATLESLISSCPALEDLSILRIDDNVTVLRVHSQTLTSLRVGYNPRAYSYYYDEFDHIRANSGIMIDAPRLKYLTFDYERSKSKIISNLGSLVKVNVLGTFGISSVAGWSQQQMAHNFFIGISRVRDLFVSEDMMRIISGYLQVEPLPQFCNLSCLKAKVRSSSVEFLNTLPKLLESCPNLKSLVLLLSCSIDFSVERGVLSVPRCLLSSLEFVKIEIIIYWKLDDTPLEVARYFVENCVQLKKLVLHLEFSFLGRENPAVLKDLLALQRRSSMCQIEVFNALNRRVHGY